MATSSFDSTIHITKENADSLIKILNEHPGRIPLKVGDVLEASWGYDQTNVDFFQVVALRGKTQCVIREICGRENPKNHDEKAPARDVFLAPKYSTFIKDNEKGAIKKIEYWSDRPSVSLSSFASAYLCDESDSFYETPSYMQR